MSWTIKVNTKKITTNIFKDILIETIQCIGSDLKVHTDYLKNPENIYKEYDKWYTQALETVLTELNQRLEKIK